MVVMVLVPSFRRGSWSVGVASDLFAGLELVSIHQLAF